jgi:hypothetical protein
MIATVVAVYYTVGLRSLSLERSLAVATAASVQPDAPHQGVLARHPLVFYFIMAYAGTWLSS